MAPKTREPQYQNCLDLRDEKGLTRLDLMNNFVWHDDPKRLAFVLSRYKFVAKMFAGKEKVLEVGCGSGFPTRIVRQDVGHLTAVDFDAILIENANEGTDPKWPVDFKVHDMLAGPVEGPFDGAYTLDTFEHIEPSKECVFLDNLSNSLDKDGALIVGIPSLESQAHASEQSRAGHVNCKDGPGLRSLMSKYFTNVFIFSMNDEVVHTGFTPMAHYLLALCCGKKS